MPTETLIATVLIVGVFVAFAVVLAWGERQTRSIGRHFIPPAE